ncbi:UDP-2-acetamido-2-deoxy-ribo-hexuluronate aminotransferase [Roseateles sp. YR242]|uniref:DegT/DnrJ/EryC1/StrS family aminotransferase n=1 Tax=Roseateles sp. YR242 TaxID=1855305 RepID=UPI0008D8A35D|nr:DegT/DnrJ/EryC1/StrS family aminotransferase [Roseateles sp. YR242]SEK57774.1 UDP-2-acetamido-2-deoxy-ribo-hexuluronate aminotransferase [Roseateles sp. YR242]
MSLPFIDLKSQYAALKTSIDARIQAVLDHGQYIMGPEVQELEHKLAAYVGVKHCITVASGTEALLIALMALDLQPGDEVITTPFTFAATAEMIVLLGGVPVFVDIEPDSCNIDARLIEAAITPRTRAIMPVSLYGQVADMDAINALAARHGNIPVIEDAAQSFGASYGKGASARRSCGLSTWGATSFFPSKPLGCYGDGGALFTNDDALAQAAREIRVHGQSQRYTHTRLGVGGRMDTLQCAVVLGKLERFDWEVQQRLALGERYQQRLADLPLQRLAVREDRDSVWAQFTVQVENRDAVVAALKAAGIPTAVHYPKPLHRQPAYAQRCRVPAPLPHAEAAAARVLSLPMSPDLTEAQQDQVVEALRQALASVASTSVASGAAGAAGALATPARTA